MADPSDALGNADSATSFLVTAVFPALTEYFDNHWHSHLAKLPATPTSLLTSEYDGVGKGGEWEGETAAGKAASRAAVIGPPTSHFCTRL